MCKDNLNRFKTDIYTHDMQDMHPFKLWNIINVDSQVVHMLEISV